MKRTKISFVGEKPIFTAVRKLYQAVLIWIGRNSVFSVGDIIPAEHSLFSMKLQERYRL